MAAPESKPGQSDVNWRPIVSHYEACLAKHGPSPAGMDWPNGEDLATRFGTMLDILDDAGPQPVLLDLGCGAGLLLDYLTVIESLERVQYRGIDLSPAMVDAAKARWPAKSFQTRDILAQPLADQEVDVILMNGVLTERRSLSEVAMTNMAQQLISAAFRASRTGIAFNVMNAHVDWTREDLFHWPFDSLAQFLKREVSRHFSFRADYGLYEYTCFVRREPRRASTPRDAAWWRR